MTDVRPQYTVKEATFGSEVSLL